MDGSLCKLGSATRISFDGPNGKVSEHALHFKLCASNCLAEYEFIIARMKVSNTGLQFLATSSLL